jgi:EmrB/QacA subfamily drug resistance transporter
MAPTGNDGQETSRHLRLIFAGLLTGLFLAALDLLVVATAVRQIAGDLGDLGSVSWIFTAYLLGLTATMPLYGKLGDLYGRKRMFQVAIVVFMAGSILAGLSQSMVQLIACRALQGLGGGGLMTLPGAIIGDLVPPRERGRYTGLTSSVWAVSSLTGPFVGGLFVDHLSWRWVFWINVPTGLLSLAFIAIALHLPDRRVGHDIDWMGAILIPTAVCLILLVTTLGGDELAWSSNAILVLSAAAVVVTVTALRVEARAREPILPLHHFGNSIVRACVGSTFFLGLANFGMAIFVPLFLQVVNGRSPTVAGLGLAPISIAILVSSTITGRVMTRTGRYRAAPILGACIFAAGCVFLTQWTAETPLILQLLSTATCGLGTGMLSPVVLIASQNAVPHKELGTVSSLVTVSRSMGQAIGSAIIGAVFAVRLDHWIGVLARDDDLGGLSARDLRSSPGKIDDLSAVAHAHIVEAFERAITNALWVAVPIALVSLVWAMFIGEVPLRDELEAQRDTTDRIAVLE